MNQKVLLRIPCQGAREPNRTEPNKPNRNRTELAEPAQTAEPAEPVEPSNLEPAEPVEPSARTPAPAPALVHGVLVKRCTVRLSKFARCACLKLHGVFFLIV